MDNVLTGYREGKCVIYRALDGGLAWLAEESWDGWCDAVPARQQREASRGHTLTEAINLTKLANEQQELEK